MVKPVANLVLQQVVSVEKFKLAALPKFADAPEKEKSVTNDPLAPINAQAKTFSLCSER